MPIKHVSGFNIPILNFDLADQYWPQLTAIVHQKHGDAEIKDDALVQETLKLCFKHLETEFLKIVGSETRASFYIAVHKFHDNTLQLLYKKGAGEEIDIDSSDFAATRRVLKIVLEQCCVNDLKSHSDYDSETVQNIACYSQLIDKLLYLGYWSLCIADFITRSQLFPGSIGLQVEDDGLNINTYQPQQELFEFIDNDLPKHSKDVVIQNTIEELKVVFRQDVGVDYDLATEFLAHPPKKLSLLKIDELFNILVKSHGFNAEKLVNFFGGLTVSKANRMSFEDCIIKNQDVARYMFRPILQLTVDGVEYWLTSQFKWEESFHTLTTNALPFGVCPSEWLRFPAVKAFVNDVTAKHDKVLEHPVAALLAGQGLMHDTNIKSIATGKDNIPLEVPGLGEIDIIFIDPANKIVYVAECKHNRSKFEVPGWRRDYTKFVNVYEGKLRNKVDWASQNLEHIATHFKIKYNKEIIDLTNYKVEGIFVINAPTLYMYDGAFRTFTIKDFKQLLNGEYRNTIFHFSNPETETELMVEYPYFQNLRKVLAAL